MATDASDIALAIEQNERTEMGPCHVIMNKVVICTSCFNKKILEKIFYLTAMLDFSRTNMFWLTLDAQLFTRIFPFSALHDSLAILGACPIWLAGNDNHSFGFASSPDVINHKSSVRLLEEILQDLLSTSIFKVIKSNEIDTLIQHVKLS